MEYYEWIDTHVTDGKHDIGHFLTLTFPSVEFKRV